MSRLEKKFETWFWFVVRMLPLLYYLVSLWFYARSGSMSAAYFGNLFSYMDMAAFLDTVRLPFLSDALLLMFDGFGVSASPFVKSVFDFVSYMVMIEFVRLAVELFLLVPRAVSSAFDKLTIGR